MLFRSTGDSDTEVHWLKGVRTGAYTWTWTNPVNGTAGTKIQGIGHWFEGDYMYWLSEFKGVHRVKYADVATDAKYERVTYDDNFVSRFNDEEGNVILCNYTDAGGSTPQKAVTVSRNDSKTFYKHIITGGPDLYAGWGGYQLIQPKNSNGYHSIDIFATGEDYDRWTAGTVLMLKITML